MQSAVLKGQSIYRRVRETGINSNYWYPLAWADQLQPNQVIPVTVWQQTLALYRDHSGQIYALEDACPHKGVELHKGEVHGSNLTCPYHGWEFNGAGECVSIPYFPADQKLPCAQARSYPTQEKYGIIWGFPGEPGLASQQLPAIPEYNSDEWFMVRIPGEFQAHFSICNENTMDVFHGFLHKELQGWFDPVLLSLKQTESDVYADYQVSYRGILTKLMGLGKAGNGVTTRTVSIHYQYPHYHSSLEGVSSLYLMRLPMGSTLTRSFSMLFLKLPLPGWLLRGRLSKLLEKAVLHQIFLKFLHQDVEMMESEQRSYLANPQRNYVEVNPAIIALQRVIIGQYERFMQQSDRSLNPPTEIASDCNFELVQDSKCR
ncbi:MAG: aromatic ring-hydroxylating dioxygenase subunit alpha [Leptolyngbyaceae cyanobacterium SM1_1_3]|nr:aromatic ring-hydroxylating dioxygenase subunit alpha [Leptolyngbyaceae cyanobacterium SM1_1_3]NJM85226.1 aromatic ring-hydroxylating dioxygenase subunit alpha [Leptolyngbyaceae cyanobacterium RM2_2_21]NJN03539.1 aromatic ring-hydroxylating dioxygenase subunit alpha [Leptolyngbyaceae cyanobacterium RM1_1_2]NJO10654.1 aromatic ring-hydroxylating dioxygenase subunit alpha [Leptolyngbyaceae cyanobacterium SL_1_1]